MLETKEYQHIELVSCSVTSGLGLQSTASIRINVNGEAHKSAGSGNGGFDAFIEAIRKVLPPDFDFPELIDYELRIPKGGSTGALTEVFITWQDGPRAFRTRGRRIVTTATSPRSSRRT